MEMLGYVSAIVLPMCNIPLILNIQKRRSSKDISLAWTFGVWFCLTGMVPAGLASKDGIFKLFSVVSVVLFTVVVFQVLRFRKS